MGAKVIEIIKQLIFPNSYKKTLETQQQFQSTEDAYSFKLSEFVEYFENSPKHDDSFSDAFSLYRQKEALRKQL